MKKSKKNNTVLVVIESLLIFGLCASLAFVGLNFTLDRISEHKMENLRAKVKASRLQIEEIKAPERAEGSSQSDSENVDTDYVEETDNESEVADKGQVERPVLDIYKELHNENENFAGWLYVEDTDLEYPIMQGPDNKFYLSHDMNRVYDKYGMLIMDKNCSEDYESPQLLIYGHNVNSGKLFGELLYYKDAKYCDYHPQICFDTLYDSGKYQVFAVVVTTVNEASRDIGLFTTWNFENEKAFDEFVKWGKDNSLYEREYSPKYGDQILTLVTCEHSNEEGRFVVLAARTE